MGNVRHHGGFRMNDNLTNLKKFFKELLKDKPTFGEKTKNSIENFCFRFQWGKWHQRDNTDPELVVEFNEGSWWTNGVLFNERGKLSKRKLELATAVPSPEVNVKYFYIMKYYDYDYDYDYDCDCDCDCDCDNNETYTKSGTRYGDEIQFHKKISNKYFVKLNFKDYYDSESY